MLLFKLKYLMGNIMKYHLYEPLSVKYNKLNNVLWLDEIYYTFGYFDGKIIEIILKPNDVDITKIIDLISLDSEILRNMMIKWEEEFKDVKIFFCMEILNDDKNTFLKKRKKKAFLRFKNKDDL